MKKAFILTLLTAIVVTSCYRITLLEQPHEAFTNSTFKGKMVIKRSGTSDNGLVQHVYALFGVCVPIGWEVGTDIVMTQVPQEGTDVGDSEYTKTITRQMVPSKAYSQILNRDYPKSGYVWLGFESERDIKSLFNTKEQVNEVDSIYVEFSIKTNDKTGTFYLDYIAGQVDHDKLENLGTKEDSWNTQVATFKGDRIGEVTYADTKITVTRPDGTTDDDAFTDPAENADWNLVYMEGSTRPGAAMAYQDKKYDKLFTRTRGWNGGDGVFTVGLPNGDVFWTFNDSFYGVVNSRTRARMSNSFPRNSIMVQKAHDGVLGETSSDFVWLADYVQVTNPSKDRYYHARTHIRHPKGELSQEQIDAGDIDQTWVYWSGDGTIVDGKLQLLWFSTMSSELRSDGTALSTYSLDGDMPTGYYQKGLADYLPKAGNYLYRENTIHDFNQNAVSYGSTLWEDEDGHIYLYATKGYKPVVARTEKHDLNSKWQYYVKDTENDTWNWQDNYPSDEEMERSSIMKEGHTGSLPWIFKDGDYYYMTMQGPYFSREVHIYRSEKPYGPFTDRRILFLLPDHIDKIGNQKYHWLYMVNLHQTLARDGELVFTTNTDPDDFWDNFNADGSADYYRPYFYRVYNWKSLYGDETPTAISSLKADNPLKHSVDNSYYNLQGQRVTNPHNGIFIHKGRKVIVP
ncbi:MAG: DUF5005 domain-containing protein [Prevotella sp.]|nr:DUF5005 domain-containing protein [Prevotella sp.]